MCPVDNRPVMLDDTCYSLGFDTYPDALFTASLLNSSPIKRFLRSLVFMDAKRPYTKEVLMRVNVTHAISHLSLDVLHDIWTSVGHRPRMQITELDLESYKHRFFNADLEQQFA